MPENENKFLDPLDTVSFVILFLAVGFFIYFVFFRTVEISKKHFGSLTQEVETEINALAGAQLKKIKESEKAPKTSEQQTSAPEQTAISDVPTFLQKINKETVASGMELSNVEKLNQYTYRLTYIAPFYRLVNFIYIIEQANLAVQGLDINPFSVHNNRVRMTLRVIEKEMSEQNRKSLKDFKKTYAMTARDPFKQGLLSLETPGPKGVIDLTWDYRLTSTGFDRAKFARIDRKNYYVGDIFEGMRVVRIQKDQVDLESGPQKFFIRFRKSLSKR